MNMENEINEAFPRSSAMKEGIDINMENEINEAFPESCAMKGGEGPYSYAQNSTVQRVLIEEFKTLLQDAIARTFDPKAICASSTTPICIADLGCSTGPNTFAAMQYIIETVQLQYQSHNLSTPEFQVFFNDQVSNDFNTLFHNLPPNGNYFAAGVPGSFHGRLFPRQSLHIVHSSSSLSWMTKLPKEIKDRSSRAWNRGRIHYTNAPKEVGDAYMSHYKMEFETFLHARAQEIVANGIMALHIPTEVDVVDFEMDLYQGKGFDLLGCCLMDMVDLGLISQEEVDSFNLPLFFPHQKDVQKILESNEDFIIEQMETLKPKINFVLNVEMYVSFHRAALEGLIKKHFGDGIVNELFDRFTKKVIEVPDIMDIQKLKESLIFVLLKRKIHA